MLKAVVISSSNIDYINEEATKRFGDDRDANHLWSIGSYAIFSDQEVVVWGPRKFHDKYVHVADAWNVFVLNEIRTRTQAEQNHRDLYMAILEVMCDDKHNVEVISVPLVSDMATKIIKEGWKR